MGKQLALRRLLLDTHALFWWFSEMENLPSAAADAIGDSEAEIHVSSVSAYEISFKNGRGKLNVPPRLLHDFSDVIAAQGFRQLALTVQHALDAGMLDFAHRDPFDRMLIAQALAENLELVSNERLFDQTGVKRIWA